ncbi:hypothetical protein LMG22037_05536 [Paraburkholderia phenoliruptrix]|jgi:hypothetical protein|uniref:Uncharacterized protein n=1 Tax=Paraburkholderia phenoliruptrix TaxID=252970 RepID=A0A6J5CBN1_9BURK|nr:hypothetical protein [Paraburkholderia phenoliruptrix]CAB3730490.1 hypothetical protein LMG22037_05536 [Paraburkholderia phenoliruptrix]
MDNFHSQQPRQEQETVLTLVEIYTQRTRDAQDRLARRLQGSTSIGASDAALRDHRFAIARIDTQYAADLADAEQAKGKEGPPDSLDRSQIDHLYVVSGRVPGDDDDLVELIAAGNLEEAVASFRECVTADLAPDRRAALIARHDSDCFVVSTTLIGEYTGAGRLHLVEEFKLDDPKRVGTEPAVEFMQELLDAVEALSDIVETHGARTLADLMYLQNAIMNETFIDHYPDESAVVDLVKALPSSDRWLAFVNVAPDDLRRPSPPQECN